MATVTPPAEIEGNWKRPPAVASELTPYLKGKTIRQLTGISKGGQKHYGYVKYWLVTDETLAAAREKYQKSQQQLEKRNNLYKIFSQKLKASKKGFWKCPICGLETKGYGVYSHQEKHFREM